VNCPQLPDRYIDFHFQIDQFGLYLPESNNMAKKKLISEPGSYPGLNIIGIVSPLRDYRLAYFINRDSHLALARIDDLPVFAEKDSITVPYPLFSNYDANLRIHHYLIGNNHLSGKLCPEFKLADFFLFLHGHYETNIPEDLVSSIKGISGVQLVLKVDPAKIKNLEGIMTDLELHMVGRH
jgi:hypothetical protein